MGFMDKLKGKLESKLGGNQPQQAAPEPEEQEEQEATAEDESYDDGGSSDEDGEADDWGGMNPNDHEELWYRVKTVEWVGNQQGEEAMDAKCREYGLRDWAHLTRVRETFTRHFGHTHEFQQAMYNGATRQGRDMVQGAGASNQQLFEPIEGVDIKTYATVQANAARVGNDMNAWRQMLGQFGLDEAKWARVNEGWQTRMSGAGTSDPMATMALMTEYGKAFGQAGQGQYGAAAAANAGQAGLLNQGQGATGAAPVSLEKYAEIMGAQSAWAQQGKDVNAMLQKQFGISALDYSNISQYWSAEIQRDYRIALQLGDLQTQYTERYMGAGGGGADDDLSV
jgi:hypothetical protein